MALSLVISYTVFSLILFYQQVHLKSLQDESEPFGFILGAFAFVGMLYGIAFLVYWGYKVSWFQAMALFGIAFIAKIVWFFIESTLSLRRVYWLFSLAGFILLPLSGYFMWNSLP